MLWFTVWLVLVMLTLGGAALLGRRLWRSGKALLAEVERAAVVGERLDELQAELARTYPAPVPPRPDLDAGPAEKAQFRAMRHAHVTAVRGRRRARLARAARHWRGIFPL